MNYALYVALVIAVILQLFSNGYLLYAIVRVRMFGRRPNPTTDTPRPISVLVPICGVDVGLYENLRSICCQEYSDYQIVFGVQDTDDPAIEVVRRLMVEFPDRDIALIIEARATGQNLKVSNLCNMYPHAKHPVLVTLDSDMRVGPRYLATIEAPLHDPEVGVVTCLYKGTPAAGMPSILASMYINEWFLPSVLVALSLGRKFQYCFGATIAVRREVLDEIGGYLSLGSYLADDYMLGKKISERGYRVHLSDYLVENVVIEHSLKSLFIHELRWARTVRTVQPLGYMFSFVMYSVPLAILAGLLGEWTVDADLFQFGLVAIALTLRIALHYVIRSTLRLKVGAFPLLVPIRDFMSLAVWACGLFGRRVEWRGQVYSVGQDGLLTAKV